MEKVQKCEVQELRKQNWKYREIERGRQAYSSLL
jgi:hypothetical protein